ncbi:MAG: hypothetical protein ACYTFY_22535, partial [Planctomycetota bacterium]
TEDFLRENNFKVVPDSRKSWKNYCQDKFNAIGVNFEFPWFTLNTAEMKEKGKAAFISLALAAIEERGY